MKKVISVILTIAMLIGICATGIVGFAVDYTPQVSEKRIEIEVDPGQENYQWGDEIVFNINVKNNTGSTMKGVEIRTEAYKKNYFSHVNSDTVNINSLKAGETKRVQLKYQAFVPSFIQKSLVLPLCAIFDFLTPLVFRNSSFDCVEKVRVGAFNYRFGFDVYDGKVQVNGGGQDSDKVSIQIDVSQFVFNEKSQKFEVVSDLKGITGTLSNSDDVESIEYSVLDIDKKAINQGEIDVSEDWNTTDVKLMMGENELIVTANCFDGSVASDSVIIDCYVDTYMDSVDVDTTTDTDGDGLVDYLEIHYCHTNLNLVDTDGDGLSDCQEVYLFKYDPLNPDSDSNGVSDANEDYDNDGYTNIVEIEQGTDPTAKDSDLDDLTDKEELEIYKTNPTVEDTDGDGVRDGLEVSIGSDPLNADSTFHQELKYGEPSSDSPTAVEVSTDLSKEQVGSLEINPVSYAENPFISPLVPGYLDTAYDITVNGAISEADLTFYYDLSLGTLGEDFQPRIYYYNEETHSLEELPNQSVTDGKVTVQLTHFSTYVLLNKVEFDKVWNDDIKKPIVDSQGKASGIDVVFVIDVSGSMSDYNRLSTAKAALNTFLDALGQGDRAALVRFESTATILSNLTDDIDSVKSKVSSLSAYGGTAMYKGLDQALTQLTDSNEKYGYKMIVMLTDGQDSPSTSYDGYYASRVEEANNNDVTIYTIGAGSNVSTSILTQVANNTGGAYYAATMTSGITDAFDKVKEETVDITTDSNNDGIPDYYAQLLYDGTLTLSNGSTEFKGIDFNYDENGNESDDYDGDGVKNGDELVIKETANGVSTVMVSDPLMVYSDTDEYSDGFEHQNGSDPMIPSYYSSGIDYSLNDDNFTYVQVFNEEDKWWNTAARNIWSTATLNWSHEDEAVRLLGSFLHEFDTASSIEQIGNSIEKEQAASLGAQLISYVLSEDGLIDFVGDASDYTQASIKAVINIKKWISTGNSAKNLQQGGLTFWQQLKAHVGLFKASKFKAKFLDKMDKVGDKISAVLIGLNEAIDIYDVIHTYSTLCSTADAFRNAIDVLEYIKNNDSQKEKYVGKAAATILSTVYEQKNQFIGSANKEIAIASGENLASVLLLLLSENPYVAAVNLVITVLDLITPATEIAGATYYLYVVDELTNASKALFNYSSKTSSYYNIEDYQMKHLYLLHCDRIYGGEFAKTVTGNQVFDLFNWKKNQEVRDQYANRINAESKNLKDELVILGF